MPCLRRAVGSQRTAKADQETITRLSSKLPFREAATEVTCSHQASGSEATCRRYTYRYAQTARGVAQQEVPLLPEVETSEPPEKMKFSVGGSFIHLTSGEWREVKSIAVGEFGDKEQRGTTDQGKTTNLSYVTCCFSAREFEHNALAEFQRRRVEQAKIIVPVNDRLCRFRTSLIIIAQQLSVFWISLMP